MKDTDQIAAPRYADSRNSELLPSEAQWLENFAENSVTGDIESCVHHLFACPASFLDSPDFAALAGIVMGRLLALDSQGRMDVKEPLRRLYDLTERWTIFKPEVAGFLVVSFEPAVLYALILFWPDEYVHYRVFFAAVLLGLLAEEMQGTEFLHGEGAGVLCDIIESRCRADQPHGAN